jgi:hypothetical protein
VIIVVGYGYWGKVLSRIIFKNGYVIDYIFTGKDILLSPCENSLNHTKFLPYYMLFDVLMSADSRKSIFIFIASGPAYHFAIIASILPLLLANPSIYIWCEKPFLLSQDQFSILSSLQPLFDSNRIFVDYPYVVSNLNPNNTLRRAKPWKIDYLIDINLFTKNLYNRPHSIELDFFPHLYLLLREFFNFTPGMIFEMQVLGQDVNYSFGKKLLALHLLVNASEVHFNYGISTAENSISFASRSNSSFCKVKKSSHMNFKNLFILNPVDYNVQKFLAQRLSLPSDLPLISPNYHKDIFVFSADILSRIKSNC